MPALAEAPPDSRVRDPVLGIEGKSESFLLICYGLRKCYRVVVMMGKGKQRALRFLGFLVSYMGRTRKKRKDVQSRVSFGQ